jgi:hypothetical protein
MLRGAQAQPSTGKERVHRRRPASCLRTLAVSRVHKRVSARSDAIAHAHDHAHDTASCHRARIAYGHGHAYDPENRDGKPYVPTFLGGGSA